MIESASSWRACGSKVRRCRVGEIWICSIGRISKDFSKGFVGDGDVERLSVRDLAGDSAGSLPSGEAENPKGVGLGEDREVYTHPKFMVVLKALGKEMYQRMVVNDWRIDYESVGEEFRRHDLRLKLAGESDHLVGVPIRRGEIDEAAHTFTVLSPLILQPVIVIFSILNAFPIASRALTIVA